jgi:hypothetical protein
MNPTQTLRTLLTLLLPLSVSAGELDGKGLICERADDDVVIGFRFMQGRVEGDAINDTETVQLPNGNWEVIEGDYSIGRFGLIVDNDGYIVERTTVKWWKTHRLDRQTLVVTDTKSKEEWQCNVLESHEDYRNQLDNIRTKKQNKADKEKNKI